MNGGHLPNGGFAPEPQAIYRGIKLTHVSQVGAIVQSARIIDLLRATLHSPSYSPFVNVR